MISLEDKIEESQFYAMDSDRAVAVVWGAIVENRLTAAIKVYVRSDDTVFHEMFRPGGPVGDFGVKIKLAYLLGIVGEDLFKELILINKVRNSFAHKVGVDSFDKQPVRDLVEESIFIEIFSKNRDDLKRKGPLSFMSKLKLNVLEGELSAKRTKFHMCVRYTIHMLVDIEKKFTEEKNTNHELYKDASVRQG